MMGPFTLRYSEGLLRRAVRAFWWRSSGWRSVVTFTLGCAFVAALIAKGDRSWLVGMMGAMLGCLVLVWTSVYVTHDRASLGRFRRMRVPEVRLELGEERFRVTSDLGVSELGWDAFVGVRQYPEFWLLYLSRAQFITLPAADLPDEARDLILAKVKNLR